MIVLIASNPFNVIAQGEWNNWHFGQQAAINFSSGIPLPLSGSAIGVTAGAASISVSDSAGNLLFYSNGLNIYNKNNVVMPNGNGFNVGYSGAIQPVCVVQSLTDIKQYYFFIVGIKYWTTPPPSPEIGLKYSLIDMTLNGGLGGIVTGMKNIPIPLGDTAREQMIAIRHHNNHDVWLVVVNHGLTKKYLSYLITDAGISNTPVFSNSLLPVHVVNYHGAMKISPDGSTLVCSDSLVELCHFNDTTGEITPKFLFRVDSNPIIYAHGIEYSINSKYLYLRNDAGPSSLNESYSIYQYDLRFTDSLEFVNSKICLGSAGGHLQMGPDWKIYSGTKNQIDSLNRINYPSQTGAMAGYERNAVGLLGNTHNYSLPQFLQRYKAFIHQNGQCQSDSIHFTGDIWPPADSIHWDFGDPASGILNSSNLPNPIHFYSTSGNYLVTLFVRHNDNRTDTSWKSITIYPKPAPVLGPDKIICTGNSTTFDAGLCAGCSYEWKDITSGLTVGTNQTFTTNISGNYCVSVINISGCIGRDTIQLFTTPVPQLTNNPLYDSICSGETTNISLTSNPIGATFHWTATLTSGIITGFSADSGLVINQTLVNTGSAVGIVTYHITPKIGSCTGVTVDIPVTVVVGDSVKISITTSLNNICAGTSVTFTATPTNPGSTPVYQWKVNSVNTGTHSPTLIYTPINGDVVQCILTSSNTVCTSNNPATSNTITMVVNPNLPVSVSVSPTANPVCAGTSVTFTATPTHGGITPVYQWKVNGVTVGGSSPTYSYTPLNGDVVTCKLTSSETCTTGNPAISNHLTMTVNPNLPVSVSISPSSNPFCIGGSVIYTATPTNGGTPPAYQWKVNGANVGGNSSTFSYNPVSGDLVSCVLTSSVACPTGNPATSNMITMIGNLGLPAGVSITASPNPFCPGTSVTFTAIPNNGGLNPSYQWKVNGTNSRTNSSSFSYNPVTGDKVTCVMTSNLACVSGNPALSNEIIMSGTLAPIVSFTTCFDTVTTVNAKPIKLKGGIPLNGTYSGPGVVANIFNPAAAGIGTKTITYTYMNAALCSASKTKTITVHATPAFTCGNNLTDIRDGKIYPTVKIGSQCWFATNLNYGNQVSSIQHQRDNCVNEKYCYQDQSANCAVRGANYQWDEVMRYDDTPGPQGLCPPGWYVPTEAEWNTLFANWTNSGFAGSPLKYSGYSGFNALLSGVNHFNRQWDFNDFATFFWSSTAYGPYKAWAYGMNDYNPSVSLYPSSRSNAFSIRCLRD